MAVIKLNAENTFESAYISFEAYCVAKNLSPVTIKGYSRIKDHVLKFMGGDFDLEKFTDDTVIQYIDYCRSCCGNNDISCNTKLRGLRVIYNHFAEMGYCQSVKIKMLKVTKQIKEVYSDAELRILLKKPDTKQCGFDDLRDWACENFLLSCGSRLSSIVNIQMKDVNLPEREIILRHTKNRTQQILNIGTALYGVLVEYLRYRQPKSEDDYLFSTWHGTKLSNSGLINSIRFYNRRRNIKKTSIHLFRHTFAKLSILAGIDAFHLMHLLGHKSITVTLEYISMFGQILNQDDKYNPLDNLVSKRKSYIKLEKLPKHS
jgi:integrase/recombinase XerD